MTDATMKKKHTRTAIQTYRLNRICAKNPHSDRFLEIYANELYSIQDDQCLRF